MSVFRIVGLVAVLASLVACADDDTSSNEPTSESQSHLKDGLGNEVPVPNLSGLPDGDWNAPGAKVPTAPGVSPQVPDMPCEGTDWQRIWDPVRGWREVPVHRCQ